MNNSNNQNLNENNEVRKKRGFWFYFWATIIVLVIIYLFSLFLINQKALNQPSREDIIKSAVSKIEKKHSNVLKIVNNFSAKTKEDIKKLVDGEIEKAYKPVYNHVDDFVDFHFSIKGEYSEIATALFDEFSEVLIKKIFKPANFNERSKRAFDNINKGLQVIISNNLDKMKDNLMKEGLNKDEISLLFRDVLKITKKELYNRFFNSEYKILRGLGISSGAALGAALTKYSSKIIAKKLAIKVAQKMAIKTGGKLALKLAGAGGSAAAGAEAGVFFGPLGAAVGGVVGGIVGWIVTDKIVIEIDKYFNKDEFKKEIISLIDEQKKVTKEIFDTLLLKSFNDTNDLKKRFKNLKQKAVIKNF